MTRTITRNRFRCTAGAIAVGALALAAAAGCSSSSTSTAASTSAAKVTLVVYSAQGYDQAMTTAFHKATGIPVKLDDNSTGPLLTQIEAMGCLLVAAVAIPLALQARALRGRSYQMLSGRTRQALRRQLSRPGAGCAAAGVAMFYVVALGVPSFGAVSGSLLADYGGSFSLTLVNYRAVLHASGQLGPLERSLVYAVIGASVTVAGGFIAAWLLAQRRGTSRRELRVLDFLLLSAIALPSVVSQPATSSSTTCRCCPGWASASTRRRRCCDRVHRVEPADQLPGADGRGLATAAVAEGRGAHARQRRADRVGQGRAAGGLPAAGDGLAAHVLRRVPRAPDLPAALRAGLASGLGRGPSALLMIRPTGVRLVSGLAEEHHLTGVVADVAL